MDLYARLNVDPASAPTVIVTHAHYDHIGNLSKFPSSDIVIAQREFEFWNGSLSRHVQFRDSVEDDELADLNTAHKLGRVVGSRRTGACAHRRPQRTRPLGFSR